MAYRDIHSGSVSAGPADHAFAITPHDSTNFTFPARGIYVGVAGDVVVVTVNDEVVTFKGAVAGSVIPVFTKRVNNTNTTATDLVGLY